jgi:hypothetical protein
MEDEKKQTDVQPEESDQREESSDPRTEAAVESGGATPEGAVGVIPETIKRDSKD